MLAILAHGPLASASPVPSATAYRESSIEKYGVRSIGSGDTLATVKGFLGSPDQKLSDNTWVYLDFNPSHPQAKKDACSIVVVTFKEGRIAEIQGVNAAAFALIAGRLGGTAQVAKAK